MASRLQPREQVTSFPARVKALRHRYSHQPQTHVPPAGTHAPARRPFPPMPGASPPVGPAISSIPGGFRPRPVRHWFQNGRSATPCGSISRPLTGRSFQTDFRTAAGPARRRPW